MPQLVLTAPVVRTHLTMDVCIDAVRRSMQALHLGAAAMPLRQVFQLPLPEPQLGFVGGMPAFMETPYGPYASSKVITVYPKQAHSHQGVVMLFDGRDGSMVALLDAAEVTSIRTAAASAVATDLLALPTASTLCLLGAGVQARTHLFSMLAVRPAISRVQVWSRSPASAARFVEWARSATQRKYPEVKVVACDDATSAVAGADIICTLTSSRTPILTGDMLTKPGAHINAVGACRAEFRELDGPAVAKCEIFTDRAESCQKEAGMNSIPLALYGDVVLAIADGYISSSACVTEIAAILSCDEPGRKDQDSITLYESLGLAVQDLMSAVVAYQRALHAGAGHLIAMQPPKNSLEYTVRGKPVSLMQTLQVANSALNQVLEARERLPPSNHITTPIVPCQMARGPTGPKAISLKLENIQPTGSYKVRGAGNAVYRLLEKDSAGLRQSGIVTASAGNFAQGIVAIAANEQIRCTVVLPDHAPLNKISALTALDPSVSLMKAPFPQWFEYVASGGTKIPECLENHTLSDLLHEGCFVSPVGDPDVMAGHGTVGLEILEQMRGQVDTVVVPWGGGTFCLGVAIAMKSIDPSIKVLASEPETACPLQKAFAEGKLVEVSYKPTFIDGCGATKVLPEAWELAQSVVDGSIVSTVSGTAYVVRSLAQKHRIIAEGAGAVPLAAVLENTAHPFIDGKRVVCVVSGGNIESALLAHLLSDVDGMLASSLDLPTVALKSVIKVS
eukprot:gene190-2367_t